MTLGMSAPEQAGGFVQCGAVASASGGRDELFGEHKLLRSGSRSRRRARTISGKAPPQPKMALASDAIFGDYRVCQDIDIPRLCRDTGPPHKAGFVFLGFILRIGANRPI
jgi:hypothetical protein